MSRSSKDSSHSASPQLPRRSLLKSLAAVPAAVAASTGQAFSAPLLQLEWRHDERFAKVDWLIREINETCVAQHLASSREGELNAAGEDVFKVESEKWFEAQRALEDYAEELAATPPESLLDSLLLAKIADFFLVNDGSNIEGLPPAVGEAMRGVLIAHGIPPTDETAMTIE
jgi:hypothetical protein